MRQTIVERKKEAGKRAVRILGCGHSVEEPHGSKAHLATWADCKQCDASRVTPGRDLRDAIKVKQFADGGTEMSVKPGSGIDLRNHMPKPAPVTRKAEKKAATPPPASSPLDELNRRFRNL